MTDFCQPQLAAKSQSTSNSGHSDAFRLPSDLQSMAKLQIMAALGIAANASMIALHNGATKHSTTDISCINEAR
jgi:hypothetical protein